MARLLHWRTGWIGRVGAVMVLGIGATILTFPADLLVSLVDGRSPGLVRILLSMLAVGVGLGIAWRFSPPAPRSVLAGRAAVLLTASTTAVLLARIAGAPLGTKAGFATGVSLAATAICLATWRLANRLAPGYLMAAAGAAALAGFGIARWAASLSVAVMTDARTAAPSSLLATLVVTTLLVFSGALIAAGGWRFLGQLRRRFIGLPPRRPSNAWPPLAGEVWYAEMPFERDTEQSKDRPVLVLRTRPERADVMKITSQDKSRFDSYLHLPPARWKGVLPKESWLELKVTTVPIADFRRLLGPCRTDVWQRVRAGQQPATGIASKTRARKRTGA